ncbi:MAG: hypothetical protein HUU29_11930 [Planctomycetaceae bacterium]|nr:hypothetical protein [Planctomycetaceae bacterium]
MPKRATQKRTRNPVAQASNARVTFPRLTAKVSAVVEEWIDQLKGYDITLVNYTRDCSRLTLKATDCIARRQDITLVFHDVSYIELPLKAHNIRARVATTEEREHVQSAVGPNFRLSSVVAFENRAGHVYLVEYGYLQWLVTSS